MAVWNLLIYVHLLRSTWLPSTESLQETPTWSKLSTPGCRHATRISYAPGYNPCCQGRTKFKRWWWLGGGLLCTVMRGSESNSHGINMFVLRYKVKQPKAIPSQAWRGHEVFRRLRLQVFKTFSTWVWLDCQHRSLLPPGAHFCYRLSLTQGHSEAERSMPLKKFPWQHRDSNEQPSGM